MFWLCAAARVPVFLFFQLITLPGTRPDHHLSSSSSSSSSRGWCFPPTLRLWMFECRCFFLISVSSLLPRTRTEYSVYPLQLRCEVHWLWFQSIPFDFCYFLNVFKHEKVDVLNFKKIRKKKKRAYFVFDFFEIKNIYFFTFEKIKKQ